MARWQVYRLPTDDLFRRNWVARQSGSTSWWCQFPTWREAFDFADREARR